MNTNEVNKHEENRLNVKGVNRLTSTKWHINIYNVNDINTAKNSILHVSYSLCVLISMIVITIE